MKKLVKKILGLTLSVAMVATSVNVSNIAVKADGYKETGEQLESGTNVTLGSGTYYLNSNVTYDPATTGSSGLTIASGATVKIYLNGHSITARGSAATAGTAGGAGSIPDVSVGSTANGGTAGTGGTKGYAGIKLPENATLIVIGKGTVNATGGAGGQGGAGGNGGSGAISKSYASSRAGSGGGGGAGGGGAGAGIGTDGTNGTDGSAGGQGKTIQANVRDWNTPTASGGTSGSSDGANSGKFYTYSDYSGAITVNAVGGSAGNTSSAGTAGTSGTDGGTDWDDDFTASGGAGGASGGGGGAAMNIGAGGTGGTGGTGGASGASNYEDDSFIVYYGYGGAAGKGGNTNGIVGNNGGTANSTAAYNINGDRVYPDYSLKGSQSTAGTAGTRGSVGTLRNLYLTGVYVKMKDSTKEYAVDDYITEDDIDVYAVYNTSTAATFDQTKELSTYYNTSMGDWTGAPNDNGWYARPVTSDYYSIVGAETTGEHAGEFKVTQALALSMMATDETSTPEGKVEVKLDDVSADAHSKGFIGDLQIDVTTSEATEGTDKGDDNTQQEELHGYPTEGNASIYNEASAVNTVTYDGLSHSISELIQNTGYGTNNGATSTYAITDNFFKKGLNSSPTESSYWMSGYALSPYYRVNYKSYIDFNQYSDEGQYLTGSSQGAEIPGKEGRYAYYASGQINNNLIKNAGYYTVEVVVPYRYKVYRFFRLWSSYKYFYRTYKFNIVVRKADLGISYATDTVYENTKVQNHTFTRDVEGENEYVYGSFIYSSSVQTWDNNEARSANAATDIIEDITWEFNVYYDKDKNNYLCQIDGPRTGDELNTYYSGYNASLIYTDSTVGTHPIDMTIIAEYQDEQSVTGELTPIGNLKYKFFRSEDEDNKLTSVYAENIGLNAYINRRDKSIGFRVKSGDAVTGDTTLGTKIEDDSTMPEYYKKYFNFMVHSGKYLTDIYNITVKAGDEVVFEAPLAAEGDNLYSWFEDVYYNRLPACEYYGVDNYDVTVDYAGLYYTTETSAQGREAGWNGDEEFNWVVSTTTFELDVNQRSIKVNPLDDLDKTYDGTDMLVSQTINEDGDVMSAAGYVINAKTTLEGDESQFSKKAVTLFFNYYDTSLGKTNDINLEMAGTYDTKNKGLEKPVTVSNARITGVGENKSYLNYSLDGVRDGQKGKVAVANMYFTHNLFGTMEIYDSLPMHEVLGLHAKAYLLHTKLDKDGYVIPANTTYDELVEKNDSKSEQAEFDVDNENYDYDANYFLVDDEYAPDVLKVNIDTGNIDQVAIATKGGNNAEQFPSVVVWADSYKNFTLLTQEENQEVETYRQCERWVEGNDYINSSEFTIHMMRYRIIGNTNTYDVLLPTNQLNEAGKDSKYIDRSVGRIFNEDEEYKYLTIYEEGDDASFQFTIPQNSYLEDVHLVDLDAYKTYSGEAPKTFAEMKELIEDKSLGTYNTQAETLNKNANPLFLSLDKINGVEYEGWPIIPTGNTQIGGSTFTFTISTGNSILGSNKAIAIIPVFKEYDLIDDDFEDSITVEKTVDEEEQTIDGNDDSIYVNYNTLFDTHAFVEGHSPWATINLSYTDAQDETAVLSIPQGDQVYGRKSFEIATEAGDNPEFFAPDRLIPGTTVNVIVKLWRNGVTEAFNTLDKVDPDAFDTKTFQWTVTEEDYYRLFNDDSVMFRTDNSIEGFENIKAYAIYDNDVAEVAVTFGKIATLVEKQEDDTWMTRHDVNMLEYADTWYGVGRGDGQRIVIANDPENDYPIESVGGVETNVLEKGASVFPTYEVAQVYTKDVTRGSEPVVSGPAWVRVIFGEVDIYEKVILSYDYDRIAKVQPYRAPNFHIAYDYEHTHPYTGYGWYRDEDLEQPLADSIPVKTKPGDTFYLEAAKEYVEFYVGEDVVGYGFYDGDAVPLTANFTDILYTTIKPEAGNNLGLLRWNDMSKYVEDKYIEGGWYYDPEFTTPVENLEDVDLIPFDGSGIATAFYLKPIPVSEVQVKDVLLYTGETVGTEVTVLPEDAFDTSVAYEMEDTTIATVDEEGKITGLKVGTTKLNVIAKDYGTVIGEANVEVKPSHISNIEISDPGTIMVGDTAQITAKAIPEDAKNTGVIWSSSDEKVAKVDENGKITAIGYGEAEIIATAADGSGVTARIKVSVREPDITPEQIAQNNIDINKGLSITGSGDSVNVKWHEVKDAEGYDVYVQYCSKKFGTGTIIKTTGKTVNAVVKKVSKKKLSKKKSYKVIVKAYKTINGKKTIIGKSIVGHFVSAKHKKYSNPAKIKLNKKKVTLKVGKKFKVKGKIKLQFKNKKMLSSKHAPTLRFSSGNPAIATVTSKGTIKAKAKGKTHIYVYAKNGLTKAVKVTVK